MDEKFAVYRAKTQLLMSQLRPILNRANDVRKLKQMARCVDCGSFLEFKECAVDSSHDSRLSRANFCMVRVCIMCQWRRGLKYSHQSFGLVSKVLEENPNLGLVHLTLTIKNVSSFSGEVFDRMLKAFKDLRRRKVFKRCHGGIWAFECTNKGRGYHPHIHALCLVEKNEKGQSVLAAQADLSREWFNLTGDSYIVGVRQVYDKKSSSSNGETLESEDQSLASAICEVCKYPFGGLEVKSPQAYFDLWDALDGRRLVGSWGLLRGVKEEENEDLVHVSEEELPNCCRECGSDLCAVQYVWDKTYYRTLAKIDLK